MAGIQYIGDCDWRQVGSAEWTVGSYGEDRMKARYTGREDKEKAFEDTLQKWKGVTSVYTSMWLEGWTSNSAKPWLPEVEVTYVGFRNGQIPPPRAVDGISTQSAQGEGTDTATGVVVSGTIMYRASRTTWTWLETSQPADIPRHRSVNRPVDPFKSITRTSITKTGGDGTDTSTLVPYSSFAAIFRSLIPTVVLSDYSTEPLVEGKLWACSSTVDYVLQ